MIHRFSFPTSIVFGSGAVREVGALFADLGTTRVLVVTDAGVAAAGLAHRGHDSIHAAGLSAAGYDSVSPNPTESDVENGLAVYEENGCDGIAAIGGGSVIDAAKAIRLRTSHPAPLDRYDDNESGGEWITNPMPPLIAIPTTAGTGSEVGRSTVIICKSNDRKTVIFSPLLMPTFAVCDPELTAGLPGRLTAATGMDALTHNLEAYLSTPYHPLADAIALGGLRLCGKSLRRACEEGADLDARADMMMAAIMGATAFQKGLGVTHSLSHPLSSVAGVHHGTANAMLLPHVLRFNRAGHEHQYGDIAAALSLPAGAELSAWVSELNERIGIPARLGSLGITAAMVPSLVAKAMEDGCHRLNPRPVTAADMGALYHAAL